MKSHELRRDSYASHFQHDILHAGTEEKEPHNEAPGEAEN